ncbi:MAG: ComF family protein [Pseudomonadota bacterium]
MVEELHRASSAPGGGLAAGYSRAARRRKARAPGWLAAAARFAAGFVYPTRCPGCGEEVAEHGGLCAPCWRETSFIAPPACGRCGAPVATGGEGVVCDDCAHATPAWTRGAAAVAYEGVGRRLILSLKHADRLDVAPIAGRWMLRAAPDLVAEADLIAPVPLAWGRMVKRRFNQAGELARELAKAAGRPEAAALDLLRRTRRTETQGGKTRAERRANLDGAFAPGRGASRIVGARVLLVDDVMTTGATLSACAEICRAAGAADVNALAFARVVREDATA